MLRYISARDHRIMKRVHTWRPPRWVRLWALCATRAGDGWLWGIIGLILLIFGGPSRFVAIGAATVAGALSVGLFLRLKKITGRKRPCEIEPHCWAKLLPPDQFSFPSGHSMTAFAVAVSLGMFYPPLLSFLLFCAFSIAISRVLLGMHFLSDVVAGSMIGAVLGFTIGDIAVSYLEASFETLARL